MTTRILDRSSSVRPRTPGDPEAEHSEAYAWYVVALMTDSVFTQAAYGLGGIRWSLLSTTTIAHLAATVLLFFGMREYRAALTRLAPTDP
jgi:hypothetical protein